MPTFSIVMASYLEEYRYANIRSATNRVEKFKRAVQSVLLQPFADWELIIVSDGCRKTVEVCQELYLHRSDVSIKVLGIPKQPIWSPVVRNEGIAIAEGDWVTYLDTDDWLGAGHLMALNEACSKTSADWLYYDDLVFDQASDQWVFRNCDLNRKFSFGTSNVTHRRSLNAVWPTGGYEHDFHFVRALQSLSPGQYIEGPEYFVGHIPRRYDR